MKHSIIIAVIGVIVFLGVGTVMFNGCKMGPAGSPEDEYNNTPQRNDDYSWFTHFVCIANKKAENGR